MSVAAELARQGAQLQEVQQEIRRLDQLLNQADQRAKDAKETASAAVTPIVWSSPPEQKKIKLSERDAEKFWPQAYTGDRVDKKSSAEFLGEVETYLSVSGTTRPLGETAAGVGCHLPRPGDRDERRGCVQVARGNLFDCNLKGGVGGAWRLGNQPPPNVYQYKLKEMTSDLADEASERGSDTSSVQKLVNSLSATVEKLNSASKGKSRGKGKKGSADPRIFQFTSQRQNAASSRLPWPQPEGKKKGPLQSPKGKGKSGAKGLTCYVCEGIQHPRRVVPQ